MRRTWIMAACVLCACASPAPCDLAPVYVTNGASHVPDVWARRALRTAYERVGQEDACQVMEGAEIWLYYHHDAPVGCVSRKPYESCSFGVGESVHQVEVNLYAVRPGVAETAYDIIHHEFLHVLLTRMGVPSREHHQLMGSWQITTINRRRLWAHPGEY